MVMIEDGQAVLTLRIDNEQPISVDDLSASFRALADEYREWLVSSGDRTVTDDVRLYVRELESGSIIASFVALTPLALPFLENANSVIDFAKHLAFGFSFLLGRVKDRTPELPQHSYQNLCSIVEPVAKDNSSQLNVSTVVNGDMHLHLHLTSLEANAAQNAARRRMREEKQPATGVHEKVVMSLHQARNDVRSTAGDRAIIESLHAKPVKLVFASEQLKGVLLGSSDNPFRSAYIVDVHVETVGGRPALYKVLAIYDVIELPRDDAA